MRFDNDDAFGFACKPSRITVLDVDAPDERLLADALSEFGPTPFIVRSGSGNFQAWYRHGGEARRVRPDPNRPIDILGHGYVVAPPSRTAKGEYKIIGGTLDDIVRLPSMRRPLDCAGEPSVQVQKTDRGQRNELLWRACMKAARSCREVSELMKRGAEMNLAMFYEPLPDEEVLKVVASAWSKELSGDNWFGGGPKVVLTAEEVDGLIFDRPDALVLLTWLRRAHGGHQTFQVPNALADDMRLPRKRFAEARRHLVLIGELIEVRPASSFHGASIYRFKGGRN